MRTNANDNPDAPPTSMTQEEAREILGVSAITRFDEILAAKNKLKRKTTDEKTAKQVSPFKSIPGGIALVIYFGFCRK